MSRKFLSLQEAPGNQSWREYVSAATPGVVDSMLSGPWGECLVAAVVAEHTGGPSGAAGEVIHHLVKSGHHKCERAADRLESAAHKAMRKGTPLPKVAPSQSVGTTNSRQSDVTGAIHDDTSSDSSSDSGSDSHGDDENSRICAMAPIHAHIGRALQQIIKRALPKEIEEFFSSRGLLITSMTLLKISFHATWLVALEPPLSHDDKQFPKVIVQMIGAQLCDKAVYGHQPITAQTLVRASDLASLAGVKIATVFGTGECNKEDKEFGALDFIVQEFIITETVEDEISAPEEEFRRINAEVRQNLESLELKDVDTEPIVRFDSICSQLDWLRTQIPERDADLSEAFGAFADSIALSPPSPRKATLIHQDDHQHNLLCSKSKNGAGWELDAVIDWESAAIADPRSRSDEEPWSTVSSFSSVIRGAKLASQFVKGTLPRCELLELVENYDRNAETLAEKDWLPYESWPARVARYQSESKPSVEVAAAGYQS